MSDVDNGGRASGLVLYLVGRDASLFMHLFISTACSSICIDHLYVVALVCV